MQTKQCNNCGELKPLDEFHKSKVNPDGHTNICKNCVRKKDHQRYIDNLSPEELIKYNIRKKSKKLLKEGKYICSKCGNTKPLTEFSKNVSSPHGFFSFCKDCASINNKKWKDRMKQDPEWVEHKREQSRKYYHNNIEHCRKRNRKYYNSKKDDPQFKLNKSIRNGVNHSLKNNKNGRHWENLVGYTLNKLKKHLEKQFTNEMSWENYGKFWEIDHITPIDSFSFIKSEHIGFRKCWSLDNLRPLECSLNRSKRNKLIKDKQEYLVI